MELLAAINGLAALKRPCEVECRTDSTYVRDGITRWVANWKRNGWRTKQREPVKNGDLWRELDRLQSFHRVEWKWVRGHAGNEGNERCDELARAAVISVRQRHTPAALKQALQRFKESQQETSSADQRLL